MKKRKKKDLKVFYAGNNNDDKKHIANILEDSNIEVIDDKNILDDELQERSIFLIIISISKKLKNELEAFLKLFDKLLQEIPLLIIAEEKMLASIKGVSSFDNVNEILNKPIDKLLLKKKVDNYLNLFNLKNDYQLALDEIEEKKIRISNDKHKLKILARAVNEPIIFVNQDLEVTFWNKEAENIFGYNRYEIVNESFLRWMVSTKSHNQIRKLFTTTAKTGIKKLKETQTFILKNKLGVESEVCASVSYHKVEEDSFELVFVIHDQSREKRLEKETIRARELREENKMLLEFTRNVSHDFRIPMNAIIGVAKTLLKSESKNLSDRQKEGLNIIAQSGSQLFKLFKDLRGISSIDGNHLKIKNEKFDFDKFLSLHKSHTVSIIKDKKLLFIIKKSPSIPKYIVGDQLKINQILVNILNNAAKFSKEGKIVLSTHLIDNKLFFEVSDTGPGIPDDNLKIIFDKFKQLDDSMSHLGAGLGLHIAKKLVGILKGEISAESVPNKGTVVRFYVSISDDVKLMKPHPFKKELGVKGIKILNYEPKKKLLLVIDDSIQNLFVYSILSEQENYSVIICQDGKSGLSAILEYRPDFIILNLEIPELHGTSIIREIRRRNIKIPIIILSEFITSAPHLTKNVIFQTEPFMVDDLNGILSASLNLIQPTEKCNIVVYQDSSWIKDKLTLSGNYTYIENKASEITMIKINQRKVNKLIIENFNKNSNAHSLFLKILSEISPNDFDNIILHCDSKPMNYLIEKIESYQNIKLLDKKEIQTAGF